MADDLCVCGAGRLEHSCQDYTHHVFLCEQQCPDRVEGSFRLLLDCTTKYDYDSVVHASS